MADELQAVVESVGLLADKAEASRWELASAVAAAYEELPAYARGLTAGLCLRLRRSTDQVYNLRDAANLRERLRVESALSVSHFATLSHLADRYNLTDSDCKDWLVWAEETDTSVRKMSAEIGVKHTEDQRKAYMRRAVRVGKDVQILWVDAESLQMPEELRAKTRAVLPALREWIGELEKWGG